MDTYLILHGNEENGHLCYLTWWTDCWTGRTQVHDGRMSWRCWGNGWSCRSSCHRRQASAAPAALRTAGLGPPCLARGWCWSPLATSPASGTAAELAAALRCMADRRTVGGTAGWDENENKRWKLGMELRNGVASVVRISLGGGQRSSC